MKRRSQTFREAEAQKAAVAAQVEASTTAADAAISAAEEATRQLQQERQSHRAQQPPPTCADADKLEDWFHGHDGRMEGAGADQVATGLSFMFENDQLERAHHIITESNQHLCCWGTSRYESPLLPLARRYARLRTVCERGEHLCHEAFAELYKRGAKYDFYDDIPSQERSCGAGEGAVAAAAAASDDARAGDPGRLVPASCSCFAASSSSGWS